MALTVLAAAMALSSPLGAQTTRVTDPRTDGARRAARAQAALDLVGQVRALPAGDRRVGDLLDEPGADRALALFLLSLPDAEPARPAGDGACRVTLSVPAEDLAWALESIRLRHDRALRFKPGEFLGLSRAAALSAGATAAAPPALVGYPPILHRTGEDYLARADPATRDFWRRCVGESDRLKIEQTARDDCLARLARRIRDVHVTTDATLGEFLSRNDAPDADLRQFLRGAQERSATYHRDVPVVEVAFEVSLRTVLACVKTWLQVRPGHRPDDVRDIEQMIVAYEGMAVRQTGVAWAQPAQLLRDDPGTRAALARAAEVPDWLGITLAASGKGASDPAATPQAVRRAEWDALCNLADRLAELPAANQRKVADLLGQSPALRADFLTLLQGARPVREPAVGGDGVAAVVLEVSTTDLWHLLLEYRRPAQERPAPTTVPATSPMGR